jgi:hypothetical protein
MSFSIRDLLWATVVVAMGLGCWAERSRLLADKDWLNKVVERYEGIIQTLGFNPPAKTGDLPGMPSLPEI